MVEHRRRRHRQVSVTFGGRGGGGDLNGEARTRRDGEQGGVAGDSLAGDGRGDRVDSVPIPSAVQSVKVGAFSVREPARRYLLAEFRQ